MTYANLLIHRCTIQKRTSGTANEFDETPYSWSNNQTDVPCRLVQPKGAITRLETGEHVERLPKLMLLPNVTIAEHDYRIVGTFGFTGMFHVLKVNSKYDGTSQHHIQCDLEAVV